MKLVVRVRYDRHQPERSTPAFEKTKTPCLRAGTASLRYRKRPCGSGHPCPIGYAQVNSSPPEPKPPKPTTPKDQTKNNQAHRHPPPTHTPRQHHQTNTHTPTQQPPDHHTKDPHTNPNTRQREQTKPTACRLHIIAWHVTLKHPTVTLAWPRPPSHPGEAESMRAAESPRRTRLLPPPCAREVHDSYPDQPPLYETS